MFSVSICWIFFIFFSAWSACSSGGGSWWRGDPTRSSWPLFSSLPSPPLASSTSGQSCFCRFRFMHLRAFLDNGRCLQKVGEVRIHRSAEFKQNYLRGFPTVVPPQSVCLLTTKEHWCLCCWKSDKLPRHKFVSVSLTKFPHCYRLCLPCIAHGRRECCCLCGWKSFWLPW